MTLVAAWMESGIPILAGDVLITSEVGNPVHRKPVPTRDDLIEILPRSKGIAIDELLRKVYVISPSLCVGFCGSPFSAADVISALSGSLTGSSCSLEQMRDLLTSVTDHSSPPCTIIGWLKQSDQFHCFRWTSSRYDLFETAQWFAIGSGRSHFEKMMRTRQFLASHRPIESAIASISDLLKDEVLYATSLPHRFGGAYNIVAYEGGGFEAVSSVLFIPVQIEETHDPGSLALLQPKRLLKTHQNGEITEVMAVLLTQESVGSRDREPTDLASHRMYYIPSIFTQPGDQFIVNSSLPWLSRYYSIVIDIKLRDQLGIPGRENLIISMCRVFHDSARDKYIGIVGKGRDLEQLLIKDPLFKEIFKVLSGIDREALIHHAKAGHL
jgi:hypothetical protein